MKALLSDARFFWEKSGILIFWRSRSLECQKAWSLVPQYGLRYRTKRDHEVLFGENVGAVICPVCANPENCQYDPQIMGIRECISLRFFPSRNRLLMSHL